MTLTLRRMAVRPIAALAIGCCAMLAACGGPAVDKAAVTAQVEQSDLILLMDKHFPEDRDAALNKLVAAHVAGKSEVALFKVKLGIVESIQKQNKDHMSNVKPSSGRRLLSTMRKFYETIERSHGNDVCSQLIGNQRPSPEEAIKIGLANPLYELQLKTLAVLAEARDHPYKNQEPSLIDFRRLGKIAINKGYDMQKIKKFKAAGEVTCSDAISLFRIYESLDINTGNRIVPGFLGQLFQLA